jgi:hypothetical protein
MGMVNSTESIWRNPPNIDYMFAAVIQNASLIQWHSKSLRRNRKMVRRLSDRDIQEINSKNQQEERRKTDRRKAISSVVNPQNERRIWNRRGNTKSK